MTHQDYLLGKTVNGYEITGVIGRGGMATVYRATQMSMNRMVAVKVLPRQFVDDETYIQRFTREVKIVSTLEHRCIVPVYDYGEYERQPYIVMRYLPTGSIDNLLENGPVPLPRTLEIIRQIAPALDYAHSKNVLHRDLKPSNILLDDGGGAYITDFGIARILGEASGHTITTQGVVGTPAYMSPEQAQGYTLDGRSDVYSLGVMLFEMATGKRPFESETPYGVAVMQVTTPPPSPRTINPNVPPQIEQVIYRAMSKPAEKRYRSAVELADALQKALDGKLKPDTQPRPIFQRPQPAPTVQTPPPVQPHVPNTFTPPPYSAPANQPPTSSRESAWIPPVAQKKRRRRQSNPLVSVFVGAIIGCGMLTLLVGAMLLVFTSFSDVFEDPLAATDSAATAQSLPSGGITLEGSIATEEPGITNTSPPVTRVIPSNTAPPPPTANPFTVVTETPQAEGMAPVGERETGFDPDADFAGEVVYFTQSDDNYDLYRLNVGTGRVRRMTNGARPDQYPAVSPDGTMVAFLGIHNDTWDLHVRGMDDRGNGRRILVNGVNDYHPAWSPDSAWIVFASDVRGDGALDLFRIRPDGSDLEALWSSDRRSSTPQWHDDRIVFTTGSPFDAATWEIALLDMTTREVTLLTDNAVKDWQPSWSPDGTRILFHTAGEGASAVAVMDMVGADGITTVYDSPGYDWAASFSPDGNFIVFTSDETGSDQLYVMRADGEDVTQITQEGGYTASWVPGQLN
ncbi:MAG: protein kinase [Chloroflexota bacterium]